MKTWYNSVMQLILTYTVKEITDRNVWDGITGTVLLQSWNWGEFQKKIGKKVYRLGIFDNNGKLVAAAQAIVIISSLRSHIYIPNGPVLLDQESPVQDTTDFKEITRAIVAYCKEHIVTPELNFIRIDPVAINTKANRKPFLNIGFSKAATFVQPEHTLIFDLKTSEDEILKQMNQTTRYHIKKGLKYGIRITRSTSQKDFDLFWDIFTDTVKRQHFVSYGKDYHEAQLEALKENNGYSVYLAYDKDEESPISGALIGSDSLCSYYLHAGRTPVASEASKYAQKVLAWKAMQDAKAEGKHFFNFYGIARNENDKNDPWYGLTFFKKSFGGQPINYIGAFDYPLTKKYSFIRLLEGTRRLWGYPYSFLKKLLKK